MMDEGDRDAFGWGNGPTAAQEVDLRVGIDAAAQMERQMQVQEGGGRARPDRCAPFHQSQVPGGIGAVTGGAAESVILAGHLAVQHELSGRVIADLFISQERDQAFLQRAKTAFDLTFGLRARGDQMGHPQGGEGALEFGTGIPIIGHGIMAKEAQAIGVDDQRQTVLEQEPAKMLKVIPGRIGGDKDRAQEFSRMIIDGQEQRLLGGGRPPLVDGGVVLPEFTEPSPFPASAGLGAWFWLADQVGKMRSDKGGDRLPMALEAKANLEFIGGQLKVGRRLQRDKIGQELAGFRRPIGPVAASRELGAEPEAVS